VTFNPAIVIPIYNHGATIGATVARLAAYATPIFIVDDGSDAATRQTLEQLAAGQPLVRLSHLSRNTGKGAAAMAGFRTAAAAGHTHALQIDADGQHDTADVPHFFETARAHPQAVVAGMPIYDTSAPKARLYGRLITRFWVWVETLSFAIGDAMLGYRLYPLAATLALIDRVAIPTRMDFDIDIVVRLSWDGVPVINVPTRVIYPPDGISHFNMLRDNLRISWMHTRLVCRMLATLPLILWRKRFPRPLRPAHWSKQSERGSHLGMRLLIGSYRLLGDGVARALLRFIVFWHWLFGSAARRASLDYLARLHRFSGGTSPRPTLFNAYRHLLAFADSALDKLAGWTGRIAHAEIDFPARPKLAEQLASGRGAILLGSHLGNLEMMRALAIGNSPATINVMVYSEHAQRFAQALAASNAQFNVNLLHVPVFGPDTAILLRDKIDRGEFVVIAGDRSPASENGRVVEADFLGAPAAFPQGPYILAALLECPVYLFVCLREADGYHVHFERFAEQIVLPRKDRQTALNAYARQYAEKLEALCQRAPFQWFNFFDFWQSTDNILQIQPTRNSP